VNVLLEVPGKIAVLVAQRPQVRLHNTIDDFEAQPTVSGQYNAVGPKTHVGPKSCRIGPDRFLAGGRTRCQTWLYCFFVSILCCSIFVFQMSVCFCCVIGLIYSLIAKRLAGKNVSEMTYFESSGSMLK